MSAKSSTPRAATSKDLLTEAWEDYELLDSGEGERLERFGKFVLARPAQQAIWSQSLPGKTWSAADARFTRDSSGKGSWARKPSLPESWRMRYGALGFTLKPTGFGHIGLFAEQRPCWDLVRVDLSASAEPATVLNLFAYTGSISLAAAHAGARVVHLDASPPVVEWARGNAEQSGLGQAPIRWIVDETVKFVKRELRRGSKYEGIILDPPSFGRGPKGQVFKLEDELQPLLGDCFSLLSERPRFVLVSCHTPGVTGAALANLLTAGVSRFGGRIECGELLIAATGSSSVLPSGSYGLWRSER